jgi:hypothetical protein
MSMKSYFLLFSGVDLARQIGLGTVLTFGSKSLRWVGRVLTTRNRYEYMDDRTLKDLGISRAQADFELSRNRLRFPYF